MSVDIKGALEDCGAGPLLPDSHFEGRYHSLQVDYTAWLAVRPETIMDSLMDLEPAIGQEAVLELMEQVLWRVMDGRKAVRAFLRAVFGEVHHAG